MAYLSLDNLRTTQLNVELGLTSDADNVWGDTAARNFYIQRAIAKLWPTAARLTRESITTVANTMDYALTTLRDVERIEVIDPAGGTTLVGDRIKSWQLYADENADPPTLRLLIPAGMSAALTVRLIGYAPYTVPSSGAVVTDIPSTLVWVVTAGARVEAYRAMANKYAQFERFQNENRQNALSAADVLELLRQAGREWQQGLAENGRNLVAAKRARLTT